MPGPSMEPKVRWDPRKAWTNLRKHKVSFEEAATALDDRLSVTKRGSGANSKGEWVTVMIWKKWADDEQVKSHEGSVCRATFRPGCDHPVCALVPVLQTQLS